MKKLLKLIIIGLLTWTGANLAGCDEEGEAVYYGPAPYPEQCSSDSQCVEDNGKGWYCDPDNLIDSETWPICKQYGEDTDTTETDTCGEVAYYGPQPCSDDADCIEENGEGWYCDQDHPVGPEECGGIWPTCVKQEA